MGISCIVTVFNKEAYIGKTLSSIQKQSYPDFEVIVVNDGSTDQTKKIIKEFEKDHRFIIVNKENGGVSSARNLGIQMAKKNHLMFIDGDDFVDEEYFSKLNEELEKANAKTIISGLDMGHTKYIANNQILTNQELINKYDQFSKFINTPYATLYDFEFIKKNNILFDEEMNYAEDLDFNLRYFGHTQVVSIINGVYYHIVESSGGLSRRFVPQMIDYQGKVITTAGKLFDNSLTKKGLFEIVMKAVKTVLNHDIQNNNIAQFGEHVYKLEQKLDEYRNFQFGVRFNGNYQNRVLLYLLKHNRVQLLLFIFKLKVLLQKRV